MTVTWEGLGALCALIALVAAGFAIYVKLTVAQSLLDFEHRFFERLNGRYIKAELCTTMHREIDRRLAHIERVEGDGA